MRAPLVFSSLIARGSRTVTRLPVGIAVRLALTAAVIATVGAGCKRDEPQTKQIARPNIVWLSIESTRTDHVGCYGYERDTTPNIDTLAREATLYENAHAVTSWTLTSHASMFTGLYPAAHKVIWPEDKLGDGYETVAEILAAGGYQTAAAVSGEYLKKRHQLDQGFEVYDDDPIRKPGTRPRDDVTNPQMEKAWRRFLLEKRDKQRPFFLFLYFWDPHHHYVPPPPYDSMFVPPGAEPIAIERIKYHPLFKLGKNISPAQLEYVKAQYDGEIRWTDEHIGHLWKLLREQGLWDNTAIIVTADHGEEFFDHGHNSHKNTLYEEVLHVPLIVKLPHQQSAARDDRLVNLIDLFPTVLDLTGCSASQPYNGRSLLEDAETDHPTFFDLQTFWSFTNRRTKESWKEAERWLAVREGPYKLIHVQPVMGEGLQERWELYDLAADPGEHHPITEGHEDVRERLTGRLDQWWSAMTALGEKWEAGGTVKLSPEEEERLRSLGYLP